MRKIGLISLALVLALGTLGVGYAAWTDTVTISGSVSTGTVDIVVEDYSHTIVWKVNEGTGTDNMVVVHFTDSELFGDPTLDDPPTGAVDAFPNDGENDMDPVSYAYASQGAGGDDTIFIDIFNVFPLNIVGESVKADFLLHYNGTIPVKVSIADIGKASGDFWEPDLSILAYWSNAAGEQVTLIGNAADLLGTQLHQSNYILIEVILVAHQGAQVVDSGKSGTISGTIEVIQWNEYVPPTP